MPRKLRLMIGNYLRNRPVQVYFESNKIYTLRWLVNSIVNFTEPYTLELAKKIIKQGDVFVDIGANAGIYSFTLSKIVGQQGKVYAFEPDPRNYKLLEKSIKANSINNIIVYPIAVSDKTGQAKFNLDIDSSQSSLIELENRKRVCYKSIKVPTISLDDFVSKKNIKKINLIKIDVEGGEPLVVKGMENTIKNNPDLKIIMEFTPAYLKQLKINYLVFLNYIRKLGFKCAIIDEDNNKLISNIEKYITKDFNILGKTKINLLLYKNIIIEDII